MKAIGWTLTISGIVAVGVIVWKAMAAAGEHVVDALGVVRADPVALAATAGVSLDVYALASMGVSEEAGKGMVAVMWAARNNAQRAGEAIHAMLLRGGKRDESKKFVPSVSNGFFGRQKTHKYADTSKAPTKAAIELAAKVIARQVPDPTGGATQWDAPKVQAAAHARDPKTYKTPEEIAERRSKTSKLVMVDGVPDTRFWRPRA